MEKLRPKSKVLNKLEQLLDGIQIKTLYVTMTKTIGVKHISLLILKISLLTLFGCGVKIHKINPIFGYRVKITPDINPIYGLIELS